MNDDNYITWMKVWIEFTFFFATKEQGNWRLEVGLAMMGSLFWWWMGILWHPMFICEISPWKKQWKKLHWTVTSPFKPHTHTYIYIWVNDNDLTATSLDEWLVGVTIPKWPYFRLVNYYNLPRYIYIPCFVFWRIHGIMFGTLSDLLPKKSSVETKLNMDQ